MDELMKLKTATYAAKCLDCGISYIEIDGGNGLSLCYLCMDQFLTQIEIEAEKDRLLRINKQGGDMSQLKVRCSIVIGYDMRSVTLNGKQWQRIMNGKLFIIIGQDSQNKVEL